MYHFFKAPNVWYKFHRRTTNIKVIEQNAFYFFFWKPTKGHNSKNYGPFARIPVHTIYPVIVHVNTSFQFFSFHSFLEICYENVQEWQNLKKTYEGT